MMEMREDNFHLREFPKETSSITDQKETWRHFRRSVRLTPTNFQWHYFDRVTITARNPVSHMRWLDFSTCGMTRDQLRSAKKRMKAPGGAPLLGADFIALS